VDPGPINVFKDLSPVRDRLQEDPDRDLRFESNRVSTKRLSMDAAALFAPGTADLTDRGRELLGRVLPIVAESAYPLALSGHTPEAWTNSGRSICPSLGQGRFLLGAFTGQGARRVSLFHGCRYRSGQAPP
jgi:chemotaxis protein MotB